MNEICPICKNTSAKIKFEIHDRSPLNYQNLSIYSCNFCSHQFLKNFSAEELRSFYLSDEDTYKFHSDHSYVERKILLSNLVCKKLIRFNCTGKLLDIGTGNGTFLDVAKKYGYETYGVEPSKYQTLRIAQHKIYNDNFENIHFGNIIFDIIVNQEFIEHVVDLDIMMQKVSNITKKDSIIYISTGNVKSLYASILRSKWKYYEALHVNYFSPMSLQLLLRKYNWEILDFGSGFRFYDTIIYAFMKTSILSYFKLLVARIRLGNITRFGMHIIAKKSMD